jgi:hypothetical protein
MAEQTIPEHKGATRILGANLGDALRRTPSVLGNTFIVLVMYLITISLITDTPILRVVGDYYNLLK